MIEQIFEIKREFIGNNRTSSKASTLVEFSNKSGVRFSILLSCLRNRQI